MINISQFISFYHIYMKTPHTHILNNFLQQHTVHKLIKYVLSKIRVASSFFFTLIDTIFCGTRASPSRWKKHRLQLRDKICAHIIKDGMKSRVYWERYSAKSLNSDTCYVVSERRVHFTPCFLPGHLSLEGNR